VPIPNSEWNPISRGVKYTGWEKLAFSTEISVYLGNGVPIVTINFRDKVTKDTNNKPYTIY